MPGRFMGMSAGPSTGQDFRRQGKVGRDYASAVADIQAMSNRWMFVGAEAARDAADIMEEEIVKYVHPSSDHGFKFSEGRLAATIGTWKPELIKDPEVVTQAERWAISEGAHLPPIHTRDVDESIEFGAYRSIRHVRGNNYSAEVGTFTPYAGLVEDGGSMPIHPYNDPRVTINATWKPHHMFKQGMFDSYARIEQVMEEAAQEALNGR